MTSDDARMSLSSLDSRSTTPDTAHVDALYREFDRTLRHAEHSVQALHEVSTSLLGPSPSACENRAILSARSHLGRQHFEELVDRYEALRVEFLRLRATAEARPARRLEPVEPTVVRRAAAYIEAHVDPRTETDSDPTNIVDIAAASGVGVRALQQAFRRYRGITPTGYLRDLRFERAHRDLESAEPSASVADIAARWGFTHPSHFAAGYRRRYYESPRDTLKT